MLESELKPVELCHAPLLQQAFDLCQRELISYNFTSLFLWNHWEHYHFAIIENVPVVCGDYRGVRTVMPPLTPDKSLVIKLTQALLDEYLSQGKALVLIEVDQELTELYAREMPGVFQIKEFAPGHNYIYRSQDLINLSGKAYDGKRNHLRYFLKNNPDWQLLPMDSSLAETCAREFPAWFSNREYNPDLELETQGVLRGLHHWDKLRCQGAALHNGERIVAFTYGEPLTRETYAIHVEKADTTVRGTYQAINNLFAKEYCGEYTYINRAEDMGEPGLRRAKESYHPCHLEKRYILYPQAAPMASWWKER